MIRRLGLLLLAACEGLRLAERGPASARPATRSGVPLGILEGARLPLVERPAGRN